MLPDPLHPAVVHFPIVLVMLLPLVALGALWTIRRGSAFRRAWAVPVALSAALTLSAWVALQTGQAQEDRVERVLPSEQPLEEHEEAAELFLWLSAGVLLLTASGLAGGRIGQAGRVVATAGAFGLIVAGIRVGASGGELVYEHGAASAYVQSPGATEIAATRASARDED